MANNVGKPETANYSGKLAVMAGCSWLLFLWPPCQGTNIVAAETDSLAVILLYYQQDQRTLERLSAAGRNTPRRSSPAQPGRWGPGVESAADVLDEAALGLDPEKPLLIYNPEICGTEVVGWVKR